MMGINEDWITGQRYLSLRNWLNQDTGPLQIYSEYGTLLFLLQSCGLQRADLSDLSDTAAISKSLLLLVGINRKKREHYSLFTDQYV